MKLARIAYSGPDGLIPRLAVAQPEQQRVIDLARLKVEAEEKAVVARAAEAAKKVAAQTASEKPAVQRST